MRVQRCELDGVLIFLPTPHHDDRGPFTRTFDAGVAEAHGVPAAAFTQDSQSRSRQSTIRGLHGFQALTDQADVCYRIDRAHVPAEDIAVRHDDPALGVRWPLPVAAISERDRGAGSWADLTGATRA
jgi:dTDP-4-dehydrorhamnose 3,5-epimerase